MVGCSIQNTQSLHSDDVARDGVLIEIVLPVNIVGTDIFN